MSRTLPGESATCTTVDCDATGFKLFAAFAADWLGIGLWALRVGHTNVDTLFACHGDHDHLVNERGIEVHALNDCLSALLRFCSFLKSGCPESGMPRHRGTRACEPAEEGRSCVSHTTPGSASANR